MAIHKEWRRLRADVVFIMCCLGAMAFAYRFEPPWRAITFAGALAALMFVLVSWWITNRRGPPTEHTLPEIDKRVICFYLHVALTFAVAMFFEPPMKSVVIVASGTMLLIALVIRQKLTKRIELDRDFSTNEPSK